MNLQKTSETAIEENSTVDNNLTGIFDKVNNDILLMESSNNINCESENNDLIVSKDEIDLSNIDRAECTYLVPIYKCTLINITRLGQLEIEKCSCNKIRFRNKLRQERNGKFLTNLCHKLIGENNESSVIIQ